MATSIPPNMINPLTPLAYLSPGMADIYQTSRYVYITTFGAFFWDWLLSIPAEFAIIKQANRAFPIIVYFASRFSTLVYLLTSTMIQVAPIVNCQAYQLALNVCYFFALASSASLFYIRVYSVFHQYRWVQSIFLFLWLGVLSAAMTMPFSGKAVHVGPTMFCIHVETKAFASAAMIATTVNDALVYLAVSFKMRMVNKVEKEDKAYDTPEGLPRHSNAFFGGVQKHYLVTVLMNLITMSVVLSSRQATFGSMFTVMNTALQSVMACRVFRELRVAALAVAAMPMNTFTSTQRHSARYSGRYSFRTSQTYDSPDMPKLPISPVDSERRRTLSVNANKEVEVQFV